MLVLPEPDGPIIYILNGQLLSFEELVFLLLTILSKFNILYVQRTQLCCIFLIKVFPPILLNIFDVIIPTNLLDNFNLSIPTDFF